MADNPIPAVPSRLHVGAAYYPEHWSEDRWVEDIRLMHEAGLTVVRMSEFAWSTMEPAVGEYNFEWLDRAIAMLAQNGILTVLSTPTAAPPAWLCSAHPDLMALDEHNRRVQFGNRCHYCVNSPDLHTATHNIVTAMAEHFADSPYVIGWQIDNEFNRVCYCDHCRLLFQNYLQEKFVTLDELNKRWSTAYWSQTYSAWDQIPIPIGPHNPGLMLEWKRFTTLSYRRYQKLQIDILRAHIRPEVWITHNFMGWFDGLDHYEMSADLDIATWDWYIGTGHNDHLYTNGVHDLTRGFKNNKNFWVMETQPGTVNWARINNALYKGEGRAMAWQAVAHGADAILYWQWRSALGGQEQYHGTLVDQAGLPRPFYSEVKQFAKELEKVAFLLADSHYYSRVAILNDYESRWSIQWQKHHKDFDYVSHLYSFYRPLAAKNIPVDIISADAPLTTDYRLVIVPSMVIIDEARAARLKEFVEHGGYLVLTPRTGMKDRDNALQPTRQPAFLHEMTGVEVLEYFALNEDAAVAGNWFNGVSRQWAESINILDTNFTLLVARYGGNTNGWLDGQPAITVKSVRTGMVYYVGTYLDDSAQSAFITRAAQVSGVRSVMETPPGVQAARRMSASGKEIIFVINHTRTEQKIALTGTYDEQLTDTRQTGQYTLPPFGVGILMQVPE
jgi:beta-galactosidase